jgi:hypothetical protein
MSVKRTHVLPRTKAGVKRDRLMVSIGSTVFAAELHTPAGGKPFVFATMPLPHLHLSASEVAAATLVAARDQLPDLFRA